VEWAGARCDSARRTRSRTDVERRSVAEGAMNLAGIGFPCLTSVAATLEGGWSSRRWPDWQGVATASEPLVAVAFLGSGDLAVWSKSERGRAGNLEVGLALWPYDATGLDVQVNFSVGRGMRRWRSALPASDTVPAIPDRRELRTGAIEGFAVVGEPRVELSLLLIARRDVRSARNGLWRVCQELADSIPEPFRRLLTYGRTGRLERTSEIPRRDQDKAGGCAQQEGSP
jgi:hypothetical protein